VSRPIHSEDVHAYAVNADKHLRSLLRELHHLWEITRGGDAGEHDDAVTETIAQLKTHALGINFNVDFLLSESEERS
jgi:hypothetical protein